MNILVSLFSSLPLVASALFGGNPIIDSDLMNIEGPTSVEVGVAELSPSGESGGYAVPASGASTGCQVTPNPSTVGPGGTLYMSYSDSVNPVSRGNLSATWTHNNGTVLWSDNNVSQWSGSGGSGAPLNLSAYIGNTPGGSTFSVTGTYQTSPGYCDEGGCVPPETGTISCQTGVIIANASGVDLIAGTTALTGSLTSGSNIVFNGPITNNGAAAVTTPFVNRFELSGSFGTGYFSQTMSSGLTSGQTKQANSIAWTAGAGSYTVRLCADSGNAIAESNESNNCGPTTSFTIAGPTNAPDLSATALTNLDPLVTGQPIRFQGTAYNGGNVAAGAFADNFQISLTSASGPWTTIDAAISHGNLPIGSSVNDASTGTTVSNPSTIYVKYCADSNNQITELDESNNCRVGSFAVTNPAGPSITSCAVSPNPANIGQTATWTATISGGTTPFTYEWSGSDSLSQVNSNVSGSSNSVTKSYSTAGSKNASVRVSDTNGNITPWYTCNTLTVSAATPSTPTVNLDIRKLNTGSWANSVSIVAGEEVELQWSASNATRCVGDSYFSTGSATSGNQQTVSEPASGSRTYTVTCYNGPSGSDPSSSDSVTVDVTGAVPSGPPEISASPTTVDMGGKTSIMWTLNGHTGCSVNGANGDTVGGNPKTTDRTSSALNSAEIYGQTKYTILCSDDGSSDQVTINVRPVFEEI